MSPQEGDNKNNKDQGIEPFLSYISADRAANESGGATNNASTARRSGGGIDATPASPSLVRRATSADAASGTTGSSTSNNSGNGLPPRPTHAARNVSFGKAETAADVVRLEARRPSPSLDDTAASIQAPEQPVLTGTSPLTTGSIMTHNRESTISTASPLMHERPRLDRQAISMRLRQAAAVPSPQIPAGQRVTLEDLVGQGKYESEAESNILAAFEQQQLIENSQHNRQTSNASTIFSNVPGHLALDMVDQDFHNSTGKSHDDSVGLHDSHQRHPSSPRSEKQSAAVTNAANRWRSLKKSVSKRTPASTAHEHRRLMSVEDQLAGLHFAMSALQDHRHHHSIGAHDRDDTHSLTASDDSLPDDHLLSPEKLIGANPSAGDLLTHHAGLLMDPNHKENGPTLRHRKNTETSLPPVIEEFHNDGSKTNGDDDYYDDDSKNSQGDIEEGNNRQDSSSTEKNSSSSETNGAGGTNKKKRKKGKKGGLRRTSVFHHAADAVKDDLETWQTFFQPRKRHVWMYFKRMILYVILPFVGIAAILFYLAGNPPTGNAPLIEVYEDGNLTSTYRDPGNDASASWWLLFVVRQFVTFTLALIMQSVIIDFLCVGTRIMVRFLGHIVTLLIVQSKGWPFVVMFWGFINFGLNYGDNQFVRHWGYWQNFLGVFNDLNPSGHVVDSDWNLRILLIMVCVSLAVAVKRFLVGLYLGRQTFHHFGGQLAKIMNKMVLVAEVATLSKRIQKDAMTYDESARGLGQRMQSIKDLSLHYGKENDDNDSASTPKKSDNGQLIDASRRHPLTGSLMASEKMKLMQLLERWEEPERDTSSNKKAVSIASVLKFRNALTFINNLYPFSYQFGLADTREHCIESSQEVYNRLLLQPGTDHEILRFETLALIAVRSNGEIDQLKAKDLVRIFRPDRNGHLSVIDFIKSVDIVYKELRFLQASIDNSSQIDKSFENIVNIIFYVVVVSFILSQLGFDPFSLFLSLSSIVLAFAFAIGSASAKYFEGLLFILVRRPYGIGDLIHVSNIESNTVLEGSVGWCVNNVTLFETEMTWLPTMERCSVSNGSLANSRIINWARSPTARFVMFLIFPIETNYETLEIFKVAVEEYLKARPREWLALNAFRVNYLQGEKAWMRIEVVVQHREAWQNVGTILDSKGNFMSYMAEVQKMLGIQYRAPPMPIDMTMNADAGKHFMKNDLVMPPKDDRDVSNDSSSIHGRGDDFDESDGNNNNDSNNNNNGSSSNNNQSDVFRSLAQAKYNIRV